MQVIYVVDFLEDKFITVEIPVMIENDFYYHLDWDKLTYEQKHATGWNAFFDKDDEGTSNWTTNKDNFDKIKENFIHNKISQLQQNVDFANALLAAATESAKDMCKEK